MLSGMVKTQSSLSLMWIAMASWGTSSVTRGWILIWDSVTCQLWILLIVQSDRPPMFTQVRCGAVCKGRLPEDPMLPKIRDSLGESKLKCTKALRGLSGWIMSSYPLDFELVLFVSVVVLGGSLACDVRQKKITWSGMVLLLQWKVCWQQEKSGRGESTLIVERVVQSGSYDMNSLIHRYFASHSLLD